MSYNNHTQAVILDQEMLCPCTDEGKAFLDRGSLV